jgi:hypothetical protein
MRCSRSPAGSPARSRRIALTWAIVDDVIYMGLWGVDEFFLFDLEVRMGVRRWGIGAAGVEDGIEAGGVVGRRKVMARGSGRGGGEGGGRLLHSHLPRSAYCRSCQYRR